jgi:hypothetical protein
MTKKEILESLVFNSDFNARGTEKPEFYLIASIYLDVLHLDDTIETVCLNDFEFVNVTPKLQEIRFLGYKDKRLKDYKKNVDRLADKLKEVIDKAIIEEKMHNKKIKKITIHKRK